MTYFYKNTFDEFDRIGGFIATWSWVGFFWGIIWYFIKGMWAKGLIMMGLILLTGGILGIPMWIYCGVFGKYDLYLWEMKHKQLW